jgi:hypothetical protein
MIEKIPWLARGGHRPHVPWPARSPRSASRCARSLRPRSVGCRRCRATFQLKKTKNGSFGCQTLCDAARCRGKRQQGEVSLRWGPGSMLARMRPLIRRWQIPAGKYSAMTIDRLDNSPSVTVKVASATHESTFSRVREKVGEGKTVMTLMIRGVSAVIPVGIRTRAGRPRDANAAARAT